MACVYRLLLCGIMDELSSLKVLILTCYIFVITFTSYAIHCVYALIVLGITFSIFILFIYIQFVYVFNYFCCGFWRVFFLSYFRVIFLNCGNVEIIFIWYCVLLCTWLWFGVWLNRIWLLYWVTELKYLND